MHLYSLCQSRLTLKTRTVSETENRTSCLTTVNRTITVSSCHSDISNRPDALSGLGQLDGDMSRDDLSLFLYPPLRVFNYGCQMVLFKR